MERLPLPGHEHTDPSSTEKLSSEREGFIRKYGLLPFVSAAAFTAVMAGHADPAEAKDVEPGMEWSEGLAVLREELLNSSTEQAAHVVVRRDGSVSWTGSKRGEGTNVSQNSSETLRTVEREIAQNNLDSLCSMHTHPVFSAAQANMISYADAEKMRASGKSTLSVPPSGSDVNPFQFGNMGILLQLEKVDAYKVDVVLDPSRAWRHRMANDADYQQWPQFWKEIQDARILVNAWQKHTDARLQELSEAELNLLTTHLSKNEQDSIVFSEKGHKSGHYTKEQVVNNKRRSITTSLLGNKSPDLQREFFKGDENGMSLHTGFLTIAEQKDRDAAALYEFIKKDWVPTSVQGDPNPEMLTKLKEGYIRNGVVIESFTYEEIENDQKNCAHGPKLNSGRPYVIGSISSYASSRMNFRTFR